jgi:predicted aldo/keto reductase-like oxidoreductase
LSAIDRREFLFRSAALGAAPLAATLAVDAANAAVPAAPQVRRKVALGRTGLLIPDIGFGASRLSGDVALVQHALARGITYYDTAESYAGSESESTLGRALAGRRDEVVLATKTHGGSSTSRAQLMESLDASLRRLRTDRVEIFFNHAVNDTARLRNQEWFEFASRAKQAGKIRFTGISGHGGNLVECLDRAVAEKLVDVLLVAFNFGQDPAFYERFTGSFDFIATQPELPRVLKKAKAGGIGIVAMKTLRGARLNDMRPYETGGATFAQAALRWTLANPNVDSLVVTMKSREQIDEYLGASGWTRPAEGDAALLLAYERLNRARVCQPGCGACAGACPAGVPIADVLRARMYAVDYGDTALARAAWAELGAGAAACAGCAAQPCLGACPNGIPIAALTADAQRRLG